MRRLYPGVKIAIGPPIENGFYYDFEFPEPVHESDLERIEAEIGKELEEGRSWAREEISRDDAQARFEAEDEPYKVELVDTAEGDISLYTQGDFTDLCRGPHLQDSKPIKAVKLTGLAGAYWRGDEKNTQLTRIYGTAFYDQADLDAHLAALEEARARDHRRLGQQLDLFHLSDHSPGSPFWHPKGMVIWNVARGPPPPREPQARLRRGEDAAPLRHPDLHHLGPLRELPREHVLRHVARRDEFALKPMNCPGHMLLFGSRLRSYRELPIRFAESSTLHRDELGGHAPRAPARAARHPGRRAHLLHARADRGRDLRLPRLRRRTSTTSSGWTAGSSSRRGPEGKLGTDEEWDFTEGALKAALDRRQHRPTT